jgi:hypothetical protein
MTVTEYCQYIRNPIADPKPRVLVISAGEGWTKLRRFYRERDGVELRLSDLVIESGWLPMPDEVFERVGDAMTAPSASGRPVVLLGLPGYLALLTPKNRRAAVAALREWLDGMSGRDAVCLLLSDGGTRAMLHEVLANPRYREGKQLIEICAEPSVPEQVEECAQHTEVVLVGCDLAPLIPEVCDTFQKYLRHTEEHPADSSEKRIVIASGGRQLAGLSAEVRQVVCLREFARIFHGVSEPTLSEDALLWMGSENSGKTLPEALNSFFFPQGEVVKRVLQVFDGSKGVEREAALWLAKQVAPKGSYLEHAAGQQGVVVGNFRSAYVTSAAGCLDCSAAYAAERKQAICEAESVLADADMRLFISRCTGESTSRVAPWLNCGTNAERAELLRRCAADGVVSKAVKDVYPETGAYLNSDLVFGDLELREYFREYRELKMTGRLTQEFFAKAERMSPPSTVQSRDALLQPYASDKRCALLVVDAMGAEWLPMLVTLALERGVGVDFLAIGTAHLPTTTSFNSIHWPDEDRRLSDVKRFDNIAHHGVETHETRRAEENLVAALSVVGGVILPRVAEGLAHFERVLVTADHGSSRLAALAWQSEPRLAKTLPCEEGAEVPDWRYREQAAHDGCPPELEETLDGKHWVVRGYDRLPRKGGGQSFELHGGATLEERLVPVVVFSLTGHFVPKVETGPPSQIVENTDFDL